VQRQMMNVRATEPQQKKYNGSTEISVIIQTQTDDVAMPYWYKK
jgi:hypothetical protein